MTKKVIKLPVFCHGAVHGIVPGNEQAGVQISLQQNMKIKKWIEQVKLNKKKGID